MRKINSAFLTHILSEKDRDTKSRIYYGYVELDGYYCLAAAESFDGDEEAESAKAAVCTAVSLFTQKPGMKKGILRKCLQKTHRHIKSQSVKKNLKVSLLLLVSDYTRVRYAGNGNMQVILLRENRIVWKSNTQTMYAKMLENGDIPNDGESGKDELYNMISFLGMRSAFRPNISKKKLLMDGDWLFLSSCAVHHKISDPEILEAYEDKSSVEEFLGDMEELYLSGQTGEVAEYVIAAVDIKKAYREEEKKQKRIKLVILIAVILLLLSGIVAGVLYYSHKLQETTRSKIEQYINNADSYIMAQDYTTAGVQYEKALEEGKKIHKSSERMEIETDLTKRQSILLDLNNADTAFQSGNMEQARSLYESLLVRLKQYPKMQVDQLVSRRYKESGQAVEAGYLIEYSTLLEGIGQYTQALEVLNNAGNLMTILGDIEGARDVRLSIFRINQLQEEKQAALEEQNKGGEVQKVEARATEAQQAVMDGDYETALSIYEQMRTDLIELGEEEEAGKIYTMILSIKEQMNDQGVSIKSIQQEIDEKIAQAEQAVEEEDILKAVELYWELSYLYLGTGDKRAADEVYLLIYDLENGEGSG